MEVILAKGEFILSIQFINEFNRRLSMGPFSLDPEDSVYHFACRRHPVAITLLKEMGTEWSSGEGCVLRVEPILNPEHQSTRHNINTYIRRDVERGEYLS
jgi:hypothetical protein